MTDSYDKLSKEQLIAEAKAWKTSSERWKETAIAVAAERDRLQHELQRLSFVGGNVGIEHPEWPPEYAAHLTALVNERDQLATQVAEMRKALQVAAKAELLGPDGIIDADALFAVQETAERALQEAKQAGYERGKKEAHRG